MNKRILVSVVWAIAGFAVAVGVMAWAFALAGQELSEPATPSLFLAELPREFLTTNMAAAVPNYRIQSTIPERQQQRTHLRDGGAHRVTLLAEQVPEHSRKRALRVTG